MTKLNVNPNNNELKQEDIVNIWYQCTGDRFGKVNLASNAEVKNATVAGKREYIKLVKDKEIPLVFEKPIKLSSNQNLHIVTYSNTHYFDSANPQKGIDNKTAYQAFRNDLNDKAKGDKTVVFFTGNLIGKEWNICMLNNAFIDENKKILFWGLKQRLDLLVKDLMFAAKNGADEIFLMNGREEHSAKQKLNVDVLKEALLEKFNTELIKYIIQMINSDKEISQKRVPISYVPGVKKVFNIEKKLTNGKTLYYDMSMHTNLKTTSNMLGANYAAAAKQHAGLAHADVILIQAENAGGIPDDDNNVAILTSQATYMQTSKGNVPSFAPNGRSSLTLLLGDKSHDAEIAWTMDLKDEKTYALEKRNAELEEKIDIAAKVCKQKAENYLKNFADRKVDYAEMLKK